MDGRRKLAASFERRQRGLKSKLDVEADGSSLWMRPVQINTCHADSLRRLREKVQLWVVPPSHFIMHHKVLTSTL
jgi:hypothetical protein